MKLVNKWTLSSVNTLNINGLATYSNMIDLSWHMICSSLAMLIVFINL